MAGEKTADYYKLLGVDNKASQEDIAAAYRKAAMEHHPDHSPGDTQMMKQINAAFEVIGNNEKRTEYDRRMNAGKEHADDMALKNPARPPSTHEGVFNNLAAGSPNLSDSERKVRLGELRERELKLQGKEQQMRREAQRAQETDREQRNFQATLSELNRIYGDPSKDPPKHPPTFKESMNSMFRDLNAIERQTDGWLREVDAIGRRLDKGFNMLDPSDSNILPPPPNPQHISRQPNLEDPTKSPAQQKRHPKIKV